MLLSDRTIRELIKKGELVIEPFEEALLSPSSLDLRLGNSFLVFKDANTIIDVKKPVTEEVYDVIICDDHFIIHPGQFILAHTLEYIKLPTYLAARLEGRSSLARLGIIIHSTGGFIDAGFEGQLTLEMTNINKVPVKLYPGMKIAQIAFEILDKEAERPYNQRIESKYNKQRGPTLSKIFKDFK